MQCYEQNNKKDNDLLLMDDGLCDLAMDWEAKEEAPVDIHASSASDGLIYSLRNLGKVDIEYISKITNLEMKTVIEKLKGSIFQDPEEYDGCYYKGFKTHCYHFVTFYLTGVSNKKIDTLQH